MRNFILLVFLLLSCSIASAEYKMNPYTGRLDNTGPFTDDGSGNISYDGSLTVDGEIYLTGDSGVSGIESDSSYIHMDEPSAGYIDVGRQGVTNGANLAVDGSIYTYNGGNILVNSGSIGINTSAQQAPLAIKPLVSNKTYGSNLLTNADFASGLTGWNSSGNWVAGSGTVQHWPVSATHLRQTVVGQTPGYYFIQFTIGARVAGGSTITFGNNMLLNQGSRDPEYRSVATYRSAIYSTQTGDIDFAIYATSASDQTFDNIILQKLNSERITPSVSLLDSSGNNSSLIYGNNGNIAIGKNVLNNYTSGTEIIAIGNGALNNQAYQGNSSAIAIGANALNAQVYGGGDVAIGHYTLSKVIGAFNNIALGYQSQYNNISGDNNCSVGSNSMFAVTTGANNTAVGSYAMQNNLTGNYNSAFGYSALANITGAQFNTAIGREALNGATTGNYNIAMGDGAGKYISGGSVANTFPTSGVFLGVNTRPLTATGTNEIVIGYQATGNGSNTATLGSTAITLTDLQGDVLVDNSIYVDDSIYITNGTGALFLSQPDGGCSKCAVDNAGTTFTCVNITCPTGM